MAKLEEFSLTLGVLLCIISLSSVVSDGSSWPDWHWECEEEKCVKKLGQPNEDLTQRSAEACRLVCGHFGALWPQPTVLTNLSSKVIAIHPNSITFDVNKLSQPVTEYIDDVTKIFLENLAKECGGTCIPDSPAVVNIQIYVASKNLSLSWTTDESYSLEITTKDKRVEVQINSQTIFGTRHGLETLSQLITSLDLPQNKQKEHIRGLIMMTKAKVRDKPVYPHRGLMLDTARNFIPLEAIKRQIDAMASTKLNVLHWHATDTQSFPIESVRVPQLARHGAYSSNQIYRLDQIYDLKTYAKLRGIRIILEIDAPAHAGAGWQWGPSAGLGELAVCWQHEPWREQCIQPPCGQLNPANPHLYHVLGDLYADVSELFPGEVFHMGGDEVFFPCWNSSKQITDLLDSRGMGREIADFIKLWAEYQATALRIYDQANANTLSSPRYQEQSELPVPIILWSSHLTTPSIIENYLRKDRYVIQTWVVQDDPLPTELLQLGYRVIFSTKDAWYLDHGFWGTTQYHSWREAYENKLPRFKAVLGGEACMWTEYVDENNLDARVWPRAAAVAERLWSDPSNSAKNAEGRLARHRKRLIARGLNPETLQPFWCYQNEGKCM